MVPQPQGLVREDMISVSHEIVINDYQTNPEELDGCHMLHVVEG